MWPAPGRRMCSGDGRPEAAAGYTAALAGPRAVSTACNAEAVTRRC